MTIYAKVGMRGHNVAEWQRDINKVRKSIGLAYPIIEDGIFGSGTLKATITMQRYLGVKPDGIVGDNTYKAFRTKFPHVSTGFLAPDTSAKDKIYFDTSSKARIDLWKTDPTKAATIYPFDTPPIFRESSIPELRKPQPTKQKKSNIALIATFAIGAVALLKFM